MTEKLTDYHQLSVWQKAHALVLEVFELTRKFSKEERAELASAMRQTATRIPILIAKGFMRRAASEKMAAYRNSHDAIEELKYYLELAKALDYVKEVDETLLAADEVRRMLTGLLRSARSRRGRGGGEVEETAEDRG